jgi:serine-type D-Ala-D-Ala carboxypeptidase/endopeptidase (penicillin-binding protein 4)
MYRILFCLLFVSCAAQKEISKSADKLLFKDSALADAHVGISIYNATANKYLYNYQANKYFVPASNTKIFTAYTALKYLRDSLPGIQYLDAGDSLYLFPTGDPTFLHKDFAHQPVAGFLNSQKRPLTFSLANWNDASLGFGWAWDDYNSDYMAERSAFPVFGNVIRFVQTMQDDGEPVIFTEPDINWKINFNPDTSTKTFAVRRQRAENIFRVTTGKEKYREIEVPFVTDGILSALSLLNDTIHNERNVTNKKVPLGNANLKTIFSQPTDSFLRIMMHRSDNFFAEQTLMMVGNLKFGVMDDGRLIDELLKTDLKDAPQQPRWVDGSGLSRYNLFTPYDFVWILNKMKNEYSLERLKHIFATGGKGTLANFFKRDSGYVFAKTGTLSGHVALSGFYITRKNTLLIFSVLVNNHHGSATAIRRRVEEFLQGIADKY